VPCIHFLLSHSLFTRISPSLSLFLLYTRHFAAARPTARERWDAWRLVSPLRSPLVPPFHTPRDHPTSVYNPPWPTPAQFRCMYEYTKGVLFRCKHAFCSLYFCGRKYCPKEEYFATTVDGYLYKTVPLPGNTCQLETDITEHGKTLQYVTYEVAGFIRSYGTRRQGPSAPTANTSTLP